jgi:hypothetical protein
LSRAGKPRSDETEALHERLLLAERAIEDPFDSAKSAEIDKALIELEEFCGCPICENRG